MYLIITALVPLSQLLIEGASDLKSIEKKKLILSVITIITEFVFSNK